MALITLRAAEEVRVADFTDYEGELDAEAVAIAAMIINRKIGAFDPATFRDRYQDALRALIEAKIQGLPIKAQAAAAPAPVFDLMAALKRGLAQENGASASKPGRKRAGDRRQPNLLLPLSGKSRRTAEPATAAAGTKRRRNA
jgi:DNA end-binding protein Ku